MSEQSNETRWHNHSDGHGVRVACKCETRSHNVAYWASASELNGLEARLAAETQRREELERDAQRWHDECLDTDTENAQLRELLRAIAEGRTKNPQYAAWQALTQPGAQA